MHFTPTSSSWLNLVERFFAELTEEVVREGSFKSVPELLAAVEDYLQSATRIQKPYRWHAKGHEILAKLERARKAAAAVSN